MYSPNIIDMIVALFCINKNVSWNTHQRRNNDPEKQNIEGFFSTKKKVNFAVKVHDILI